MRRPTRHPLLPSAALPILGAGLLALTIAARATRPPGNNGNFTLEQTLHFATTTCAAGALYLIAVHLVRTRANPPWIVPFILATGLVARLVVFAGYPMNSNDIYRYVWDGRVQAAGINPYRYLPVDPALASLRDAPPSDMPDPETIFPNVNRATYAPTIYPPAAQAIFLLVGLTVSSVWTMKAVMLGFDLITTGIALLMLRAAGRPAAQVLVWAWNPLVIWEFANAGHIDAAATAFSALALYAAIRSRSGLAGIALAAAVLTKFLPAALFPALWRPRSRDGWDWKLPAMAAITILAAYACYASAGSRVLGFLFGYAAEEGIDSGSNVLLLRLLDIVAPLPAWSGHAYQAVALLILGSLALWTIRLPVPKFLAARAAIVSRQALILSAALLALLSPHYPWYLTMLAVPAILTPAWSALWPTAAAPLLYIGDDPNNLLHMSLVYLPALPLLLLDRLSRLSGKEPD